MWYWNGFVKTALLGTAMAAVHFYVTIGLAAGLGLSAMSSEPTRVPYAILERVFHLCCFPLALLPLYGMPWLVLNSAICGFTLAAAVRWLWRRRRRFLAA